ncbi:hypothetical protein ACWGDT_30110 [Streptomyces avermitilis]
MLRGLDRFPVEFLDKDARGPEVATWHEDMSVVHSGEAVTAVVAEAARYYPWPDLVYLPVRDAPPCRWVLVWRTAGETPLVRALAQAAHDTANRA